jgi:eukaryotic-like serine/threonine-protein kinase
MENTKSQDVADLLSGWMRTGGLLQSVFVRDFVARDTLVLEPGTRVGAWRILDEIGRGGMGVVFHAERADGAYRQEVALKLIDGNAVREDQHALFVRERQLLAELEHPGIVRLLDGGELPSGQPWFALELVRGEALDHYAEAHALSLAARVDLLIEVAGAVAYAHQRLVIHRDLKPGNVLVTDAGHVKLLDFGISGFARESNAAVVGLGTLAYASPEQRAGAAPGTGDDVYALGRLLERIGGSMPPDLQSVVAKATAGKLDASYASVVSLIDDLHAFRTRRPVAAHAGGLRYRMRKQLARHPWATIAGIAALIVVGAFVAALAAQRTQARAEAARAQAINRFLNEDVLTSANPGQSGDVNLSVRTALDRAASTIDARFGDDPIVREGIESTLARSYAGIGVFDVAEGHAQRAAAINAQRAGKTGPETWAVRGLSAEIAGELHPVGEADPAFAGVLDEMARAGALDTPLAVDIAFDRTTMHARSSDSHWVVGAMTDLLSRARRVYGDASVAMVKMESTYGNSLAFDNRLDEAETLLRSRLAKPAIDDPAFALARLDIQENLAFVLRRRGKPEDALQPQKEVVEEYTKRFGRTQPSTLHALNEYAGMLQDANHMDEAGTIFREVLDIRLKRDGEENYKTRTSMNNLGMLLSAQGKLDEAADWLGRVYTLEQRLSGPDSRDALFAAHNLAGVKRDQGEIDAALAMQKDAVARAPGIFAAGRPEPAIFRYGYAITLIVAQNFDQARSELTQARDDLVRTLGADHPRVRTANEHLAELARDPAAARLRVMETRR